MRPALNGLTRYITTVETAKHRTFQVLDSGIAPDNMLIVIALDDWLAVGVLSSQVHVSWSLAAGSRLGVGNDPRYNKTRCFDPFPFPDLHAADKFDGPIGAAVVNPDGTTGASETFGDYPSDRIRALGEQLDAHRKRQQAAHPELTLTGMYNVLEKLRSGEVLSARERTIHEQGLVSVLRQIHDELDAAVLGAYGWADLLPLLRIAHGNDNPAEGQSREEARRAFDEAVLERLVALNAERAAEEARGLVRWLRPEFQNPAGVPTGDEQAPRQDELPTDADEPAAVPAAAAKPTPWPKDTVDQVRAVAEVLAAQATPMSVDDIAARFTARGPWKRRLPQLLEMLVALGRAQEQDGRFSPGACACSFGSSRVVGALEHSRQRCHHASQLQRTRRRMKTASLPSLRVDPALREAAEAVLQEGETLSSFVEQSVRAQIRFRQQQAAFIARGLDSRARARQSGRYVDADEVLAGLGSQLEKARNKARPA